MIRLKRNLTTYLWSSLILNLEIINPEAAETHRLDQEQPMNPETARSQDPNPEILLSYQEIQNELLQILNSELDTIVHVFQAHCDGCHYIGWNFRIMVLLLAWKYGQGEQV